MDATILLGSLATLKTSYEDARALFEKAGKLAEDAVRIDPEGEGSLLAQADAQVALARVYTISDPLQSQRSYARALAITEKLLARPNPSYRARLQAAVCLVNKGAGEAAQGRPTEGNLLIERAQDVLAPAELMPPPDALSAAMLGQTAASIGVYRGLYLCQVGKKEQGMAILKAAIDRLRRLSAMLPGSFGHQFLTMQHLVAFGQELTREGKGDEAAAVFQEIDQIRSKLFADLPQMVWLKNFGDVQRSELLIWKVRANRVEGVEAEMDALVKPSDARTRQTMEYNSACLYARLAEAGPKADQERHAAEAVRA